MAVIFIENKSGMDNLLYSSNGAVGRHMRIRGNRLVAAAKAQVGVRTGALRASIHMRHMRDSRGQYIKVGSNLHYARLHHEGSAPHTIRPTRAKMLRFESKGQQIFAHLVKHPGTPANRYLTDNLRVFG
jgi:hypothetical protein